MSDLVAMDKTYLEKIRRRRDLIATETKSVVDRNPVAEDAVRELYDWIFGTYLPKRFPSMFTLVPGYMSEKQSLADGTGRGYLHNLVTNEHIPLEPPSDPVEALKTLGSHVDDEFLILLPTADPKATLRKTYPTQTPTTPYHLHAYILAFPSGFNTPQKFGLPLASIHAPVPGYAAKLEKSMDKYFAALPFGKVVQRANWGIQSTEQLFKLDGNHLSTVISPSSTSDPSTVPMAPPTHTTTQADIASWTEAAEDVDVDDCFLRCERQTLHRLEKTGAVVFAFKTYLYPVRDVKEEGFGEEMARAIEGFEKGSVSGMRVYKRSVVWGRKVVEFLRGEAKG